MNVRLCTVYAFANLIDLHPNAERQKWCSCSKANNNKPAQDKPFALSSPLYCPIVRESDSLGHTHTHHFTTLLPLARQLLWLFERHCLFKFLQQASESVDTKNRQWRVQMKTRKKCDVVTQCYYTLWTKLPRRMRTTRRLPEIAISKEKMRMDILTMCSKLEPL